MNDVLLSLETHMGEVAPNECVGLLFGNGNVIKLINQARSPHRFFVNPQQLLDHDTEFASEITALYHSHPHRSAEPSGEDERMMKYLVTVWPDTYHIILSPQGHRAYHVESDTICERELPW